MDQSGSIDQVGVDQVCYLGKLDGKDLLVLEVHEEAVHQQLVVDVPRSYRQTDRSDESLHLTRLNESHLKVEVLHFRWI